MIDTVHREQMWGKCKIIEEAYLVVLGVPAADLAMVGVPSGVATSEAVPEEPLEVAERRLSCSEESEEDSDVNLLGGPGLILKGRELFPCTGEVAYSDTGYSDTV